MISRRIGRYEIDRLLGEGGVGRVYAAHDTLIGRRVAIKTLRPEASRNRDFIERFLNEAKSFGDLRHPNITGLYDLDLAGQPPHMIMELVEGHTLEELLEWGPLAARECLAVVAQVTAGLSAAHRKGVVHRDIKPSNLMVTESGLLKIMDFGIARVRGSQRLTRADQVFATLLYASPEQLRGGEVDERSDIYSLAAVAYEILAGHPPFMADNDADLRAAQLETPPPPLAPLVLGLAPRIEAGILRGLAKHPEDRFATVEAFADAIGVGAIRRNATEILEGYFTPLLRRVSESHQTRLVSLATDTSTPPGTSADKPRREAVASGARPSSSMRRPLIVLGAATVALFCGIGFVVWTSTGSIPVIDRQSSSPQKPETPKATGKQQPAPPLIGPEQPKLTGEQQPPAPSSARPVQPKLTDEQRPPALSSARPEQPKLTGEQRPPAPSSARPEQPKMTDEQQQPAPSSERPEQPKLTDGQQPPTPSPGRPEEQKFASKPPPSQELPNPSRLDPAIVQVPPTLAIRRYPEGKPQLEGVVSNFGSAEWISVNGQKVQLYGIHDIAQTPEELNRHQAVMSGYLHRGQTYVVCYLRPGNTYRCYADDADIADVALKHRIAKRSEGTP